MGQATYDPPSSLGIGQLIYTGRVDRVHDLHVPVAGKNEWGVDTLRRHVSGTPMQVEAFEKLLAVGQKFQHRGHEFYLQTWEPDENAVFPVLSLFYKGLMRGIPEPLVSTNVVELTATRQAVITDGANTYTYVRYLEYTGSEMRYRYIAEQRPTKASYTIITNSTTPPLSIAKPYISSGLGVRGTTATAGVGTGGRSALGIGQAGNRSAIENTEWTILKDTLTLNGVTLPDPTYTRNSPLLFKKRTIAVLVGTENIFGSPYWECEDMVRQILE